MRYPFHDQQPAAGTRMQVAPGVHWVRMPLPIALNHINLWLIEDGEHFASVDSGMATPQTREAWEAIFASGVRLSKTIATHYHPDHLGLLNWLSERFAVPVYMSLGEFVSAHALFNDVAGFDTPAYAEHFVSHGLPAESDTLMRSRGSAYLRGIDGLPLHYRRLSEGSLLEIGGHSWRCIAGFGHSPEHMALYNGDAGVLISGDMLLPKISTNVACGPSEAEGDPLAAFLASIERFLELPNDTLVLPSHGKPFVGIHGRVKALLAHHEERLHALAEACDHPRHAYSLIPVLFGRELDHYQTFFAMSEGIAHLNHLWHQGVLQREAIEGVWHFQRGGRE
ncbi:MBL fold metallo-hydrolase [Burkholderiaceae bacterium DAT-1]|nr:MBL fold metallo-hydrolase [Burkholderiaceae bacterium DAT-1]